MDIQEIFRLYDPELRIIEERLQDLFKSTIPPIPLIGKHLVEGGGKRIRPLLLILSEEIAGYKEDARLTLGGIIESIHTASLLHDDVVDAAEVRRGKMPAHSIWGNQAVILVGDFLYSNALRLAGLQKNHKIMETLSEATTRMTEGEIRKMCTMCSARNRKTPTPVTRWSIQAICPSPPRYVTSERCWQWQPYAQPP